MPKSEGQKLKALYLERIFAEHTDEEHGLTLEQIARQLESRGIHADRKTLYADFRELSEVTGADIKMEKDRRSTVYKQMSREFDLEEVKLLVDAVQSSKFLSENKSRDLIKKLEMLVSRYQRDQLQRFVSVSGRVKTMNQSAVKNIGHLHEAIAHNKKIAFRYSQWNLEKQLQDKGKIYHASPWALVISQENYYLVAYDSEADTIKHYRVDKMSRIREIPDEEREGYDAFSKHNIATYTSTAFGMFGGEATEVTLLCPNEKIGIVIDQFGKEAPVTPVDDAHFRTTVTVVPNDLLLGWLAAVGLKVIRPQEVADRVLEMGQRLIREYGGEDTEASE